MTQYIGLDAHSKTFTAVVMDSKGKILKKEVFPTSERELLRFVDSVKRPRVLTFEEGIDTNCAAKPLRPWDPVLGWSSAGGRLSRLGQDK